MAETNKDTANRALRVTPVLNAPINLVWEVWTNPEHLAHWWGPSGFTITTRKMEVREGGEWLLTMHGPDGKKYPNKSVFIEIAPFKKIVFQHFNPNYIATIFFESEEKRTVVDWTMQFETAELFDIVVKTFKADEGLKQNAEKLNNYLNEIKENQNE